jgi:hypothetical protein
MLAEYHRVFESDAYIGPQPVGVEEQQEYLFIFHLPSTSTEDRGDFHTPSSLTTHQRTTFIILTSRNLFLFPQKEKCNSHPFSLSSLSVLRPLALQHLCLEMLVRIQNLSSLKSQQMRKN